MKYIIETYCSEDNITTSCEYKLSTWIMHIKVDINYLCAN